MWRDGCQFRSDPVYQGWATGGSPVVRSGVINGDALITHSQDLIISFLCLSIAWPRLNYLVPSP